MQVVKEISILITSKSHQYKTHLMMGNLLKITSCLLKTFQTFCLIKDLVEISKPLKMNTATALI